MLSEEQRDLSASPAVEEPKWRNDQIQFQKFKNPLDVKELESELDS